MNLILFRHGCWVRLKIFLILCLCIPLLLGCWDEQELEHMFYVHAVGFDYQGGKYKLYVQILNPMAISKESSKSAEQTGAWIGKGTGSSLEEALHNMYASTQRKVYWGHLDAIVFSETILAQKGVQEALDILTRYHEVRYTPWIFCTNNSVPDVLYTEPILESSPVYSLLSDPNEVYNQSSFIEPMRLHRFIVYLQEPGRQDVIPEISVTENQWIDAKTIHPEIKISGYGLLRDGKLVGRLSRDEATGLRWFLPHLPRAVVTIDRDGDSIATLTSNSRKCRVQPVSVGGHPRFDMQIRVSASVVHMEQPLSKEQLESMASQKIEKDIRKTYANGLRFGVDIYSLADSLYRQNPQAFHRYAKNGEHVTLSEDSLRRVQVKVRIHNIGKVTQPPTRFTS